MPTTPSAEPRCDFCHGRHPLETTCPELAVIEAGERLPKIKRSERSLQAACLTVFRAYGIVAWGVQRERAGRARASHIAFAGHPDIAGVLPGGRAFFAEIKLPGAKPTPQQVGAMQMLARQGAFVCLVHEVSEAEDKAKEATRDGR